jgi:hypothetical protein
VPTQEFLQLLIHLPVAYLLVYSARLATPVAPKQGRRRVLWARNRLRVSRLLRTPSLPRWLRRVPVELLRMRQTDSQLALEYYRAAMSGPVAHGATPERCGATLTWPAVEFAFGPSALAVLQSRSHWRSRPVRARRLSEPHRTDRRRTCSRRRLVFLIGATGDDFQCIVGQRPLQRLRLVPRSAHPDIALLIAGQDDRHGLGVDGLDNGVR